jgi:hypothetical protein
MSSFFRITDGKGFAMQFANGWSISVQFGRGNYADNYDERGEYGEDYSAVNQRCGQQGSRTAECAVFNNLRDMVTLPGFMFDDPEYADIVSNRSRSDLVLRLMNWAAEQPEAAKESA